MASIDTWTNTIEMSFSRIPGGSFLMGEGALERDELPMHRVTISEFYMQQTPVTNAQYERFDPEHAKRRAKSASPTTDNDACVNVSHAQAEAFAQWLSLREGRKYRLPTEAEWEYACRAGTHTAFSTGDTLPGEAFIQEDFWSDEAPDLSICQHAPNAWGLYDMHGLVEEWCLDWYAPYSSVDQQDPCGPRCGRYRVTRGGSVNTQPEYLRSANRMAALPDTRNAITGFRLVCASVEPHPIESHPRQRRWQQNVSQTEAAWQRIESPVFRRPLIYVQPPASTEEGPMYPHNHVPTLALLKNGDLLAAWFSAKKECGRELTVLASRFRFGAKSWDPADEFYKIADRNMSSTALVQHPNGTLFHFNGVGMSGTEFHLVSIFRTSTDNGVTWSKERYMNPTYSTNKPICAPTIDDEGCILVPADLYDLANHQQGTVLYRSNRSLNRFTQQTTYGLESRNFMTTHGKAGWIAGVHGAVIPLRDGRLMALGRSESRCGRQLMDGKMPMSLSDDRGRTWSYRPSPFPPIGYAQRCCLLRLAEGPIVLFSFTDPKYDLDSGNIRGMDLTDAQGAVLHGYGLYAALSFDEGETWPVQRLITTREPATAYDPGASCQPFLMDATHGQPVGYMQAVQSPDGVIHLISSRLHYRFNYAWLLSSHTLGITE